MGKLSNLWTEYKSCDKNDPHRRDLQKEINKLEAWMIQKGYKTDGLTQWYEGGGKSKNYPWHSGTVWLEDIWMIGSMNEKGINYNNDGSIHI